MAVAQGYGKTSSSGLVFAYDTGDIINSYKGIPGTNILAGALRNYNGYSITNYSNGKLFESNGYTETTYVPTLGNVSVESVDIYNVYSSYGGDGNYNCCPSLFRYSTGWLETSLTGNTTYTYQVIYKCASGYTNANYLYHYEYTSGGSYITEFGVHDESRREHLGDGWYHAWGTFTTNASTAKGYFGLWYYQYNTRDKVSIAGVSLTQGSSVIPPKQFIPANTTRSATQGLLPLVGNSSLDLSNVSFNSSAGLIFDGTNDYVDYTFPSSTGVYCLEMVWYNNNTIPNNDTAIGGPTTYQTPIEFNGNGSGVHLGAWTGGMTNEAIHIWSPSGATSNRVAAAVGYHHVLFNWNGTTYNIWLDGINTTIYYQNGTSPAGLITATSLKLGRDIDNYCFNGQIPVTKIYNRALTQAEITQNYRHYKTRFNLS